MGLDMYAMATKEKISEPVDFTIDDAIQIHYWRKHPKLHGWMEALYYRKGGRDEFNCATVSITLEDLQSLEARIRSGSLPSTIGPFFGVSDGSEIDDDLAFIETARSYLNRGFSVFYDAWW